MSVLKLERGVKNMYRKRRGLQERWIKQSMRHGEQKVGGVEMVHGRQRKEKTINVIRDEMYRSGERRKRWDQQYGVYQERPRRGRALGTKRGRTLRTRRRKVKGSVKIWEKRELGRRRQQNIRTSRDVNLVKRRDRQQKRIWNGQILRLKEREQKKKKKSIKFTKQELIQEKGRYNLERVHRRSGKERVERTSIRILLVNERPDGYCVQFGVHGNRQVLKTVGGERQRNLEK